MIVEDYIKLLPTLSILDDGYGKRVLKDIPTAQLAIRIMSGDRYANIDRVVTDRHIDFSLIERHSIVLGYSCI